MVTQPRIFVTYAPMARPAGAAAGSRRAREPMVAALAGALLAGGGLHTFGGPESAGAPLPVAPQAPGALAQSYGAEPPVLPHLAFLAVLPAKSSEPPAPLRAAPEPAPRPVPQPPVKSPRRDLAGFLEDRGLALAAPDPVSGIGEDLAQEGGDQPVALAAAPIAGSATAAFAPAAGADPAPAAPETASELQTFPIVAVAGQPLGAVTMRGDSVHLASLVGLLQLKLPEAEFERLRDAPAADSFVTIDSLREAGIDLTLDDSGERISLSVR